VLTLLVFTSTSASRNCRRLLLHPGDLLRLVGHCRDTSITLTLACCSFYLQVFATNQGLSENVSFYSLAILNAASSAFTKHHTLSL
jgi:hypothetical protein